MRLLACCPAFLLLSVSLIAADTSSRTSLAAGTDRLPDRLVIEVYEDVLGRKPHRRELSQCDDRSEHDLRARLLQSREHRRLTPEEVIRRGFADAHHRDPSPEEMRRYRRHLIDDHWSIGRVRREIAQQHRADRPDEGRGGERPRHRGNPYDRVIERAYDDLLEREPDPTGRDHYRRLLERGLSEADLRARLRESEEYRVTLPDSKTTRAYEAVLGREPDASGMESYRRKIVDRGWTQQDVEADLRRSAEYRSRQR